MEWSEEKTILLIDIYKSKPMLWYPKHNDHFKKCDSVEGRSTVHWVAYWWCIY